jgi:hypothetical protein
VGVRILLAIVVALGVPVSQLRTADNYVTCCCPDPAHCHCPDHKPDHSGQPKMGTCHRVQHELVSPEAPTVAMTEIAFAHAPTRLAPRNVIPLHAPHALPPPADPDGPS